MAEDKEQTAEAPADAPDPNEGPGKGKPFFDRAKTVAATGNYDFAISMYIEGLFREPFNAAEHQALREVAMNRKIAGGKKSGGGLLSGLNLGGPKLPYKGKTPKEGMLNNEFTLARDVGNISAMLAIVRNADQLNLKDVVLWAGALLKEANRTSKSPKLEIYTELAEIYAKYEEFLKACDAINAAAHLKPQDMELASKGNHYAALATMKQGKYDQGGDFKGSIKDKETTKQLLEEENLGKSEEYRKKALETAEAEYNANPKELQVIQKYAKALDEMGDEEHETQAMELLKKAFEETKIYRLKMFVGDIRIKQYRRHMRMLVEGIKTDPNDKEMLHQLDQLKKERLSFELEEFQDRADHMPMDLTVKYQLGRRLWEAKRFDDAIMAFQEAQNNPKHRVDALFFLGRCFLVQGMKHEAAETLERAIECYDLAATGDKVSKDLHYWFGRALQENGNTGRAIEVYSKIVQWEMGYLDARKRLAELRAAQPSA